MFVETAFQPTSTSLNVSYSNKINFGVPDGKGCKHWKHWTMCRLLCCQGIKSSRLVTLQTGQSLVEYKALHG